MSAEVPRPRVSVTPTYADEVRMATAFRTVREDIERLVPALTDLGYVFQSHPVTDLRTSTYLPDGRQMYLDAAHESPPLALDLWWEHVGPVDLVGDFSALLPADTPTTVKTNNGRYLDALQVYDVHTAVHEMRMARPEFDDPVSTVDVASDFVTKANYGGAGPVAYQTPAPPDPVLVDDNQWWPHGLTFTEMVWVSMSWAGLPGLRAFQEIPSELTELLAHLGPRYGRTT